MVTLFWRTSSTNHTPETGAFCQHLAYGDQWTLQDKIRREWSSPPGATPAQTHARNWVLCQHLAYNDQQTLQDKIRLELSPSSGAPPAQTTRQNLGPLSAFSLLRPVSSLVGALSPVNHRGLHQGCLQRPTDAKRHDKAKAVTLSWRTSSAVHTPETGSFVSI